MSRFLLRRLLFALFIIVAGAFIVYGVIRCLPSSFVETMARQNSQLPGAPSYQVILEQLNRQYGLDQGIIQGYITWFKGAIVGEFGDSWVYAKSVTSKFGDVIWYSVILNVITFIVQTLIAIPLGIVAAKNQYGRIDYTVTVLALMGISLPSFFLATLLKYVFAIRLGWFDLFGAVGRNHPQLSSFGKALDILHHMVLPTVTLTMLSIGGLMRFTRTNMLEVLNADYIRTARAKGLSERTVLYKHAFRNTLIPLVTTLSYLLPSMFAGSMITETMFQIPGIGYISYGAMVQGDIPFTMFYSVFIIVLTQVSLLIADIMYAVVDPRVRVN